MFSDVLLCAKRLSAPAKMLANLGKREVTYQFSTPSLIPLYDSTVAKLDECMFHLLLMFQCYIVLTFHVAYENAFKIEYQDDDNDGRTEVRTFCANTDKERDKWIQMINTREKSSNNE